MTTEMFSSSSIHRQLQNSYLKTIREYVFAFLLAVLSAILVLQLWNYDWLYIPFVYDGDGLFYAMTIKSVITTGWYLTNPSIGVPDGHFLGDFPTPEGLNYFIIKMMSLFSSNWALIYNVFFLLGFPLITISALFVLRSFGICYPFALTASVLYSFLPFHLIRGEFHVFLSAYYIPPLAIWLAAKLHQNALFEDESSKSYKKRLFLSSLICVLMGSTGVYYAYFGAFFILLGGVVASYSKHQWRPLKHALLFVFIICVSMTANIWPTISYQIKNGTNLSAMHRSSIESEIYGLKIAQLLLPVDEDRIFSQMKRKYNKNSISTNENATATLGLIGSIGFLILIGRLFLKRKELESSSFMAALEHFNLSAVLLATIGGFSSLIAFFFLSSIRCYNRISVFIGFFALAAFFFLLQRKITNPKLIWCLSMFLLGLGLFNQSSKRFVISSRVHAVAEAYNNDRAFFQKIEKVVPPGSKIFQLPFLEFPEGPVHHMCAYDHFRAPLHTNALKWSFGAMKGRKIAQWQKQTSGLDVKGMLQEIVQNGFTGLYIDRNGYEDAGQSIESSLSQLLNAAPLIDKHQSFWDLRELVVHQASVRDNVLNLSFHTGQSIL